MKNTWALRLTALSAALAAAGGTALAQEQEPLGTISAGVGVWSKDRPQWGVFDGMSEKDTYLLLDGRLVTREEATGTWFRLDASNLGLNTRGVRAEWLRQGNIGFSFEYDRIPRENPLSVWTAVGGIGTTVQRVPADSRFVSALETRLGTVRERTGVGIYKSLGGGLSFNASFKTEEKRGTRMWSRGGEPEFVAEPIDSTTRQLEAALSYAGQAYQLQGGYYFSSYTNHNDIVDTARVSTTGTLSSPIFLSLPLDNQAHQFFLNGGYNFSPSTRATFKAAYTRITQAEQVPIGSGVVVFTAQDLDGRIDNTLLQAGLTSRFSNEFSWLANLRYYDSDERTPQRRFVQASTSANFCDGSTTVVCVDNVPLRFKTLTGKLEGTYRFAQGLSLTGGAEHSNQDRSVPIGIGTVDATGVDHQRYVPFRAKLDETTLRVQLRRSLSETVNGSVGYAHSKRDGSELTRTNEEESDEINPINIADRERNKFKAMVDWTPVQPLTVTLTGELAKDQYGTSEDRPYGLTDGTANLFSIDVAYALTERWQVNAWYTHDETKARQRGQRAGSSTLAAAEKEAELEDIGNAIGVGLRGRVLAGVTTGLDLLYTRSVNKYPESLSAAYQSGVAGPLPDITNRLTRLKLYAIYALQKNADIRVDYIHEHWKTDDWSWYFADRTTPFTFGSTSDGTTVVQNQRQVSDFIGVRYIYRFD